MKKIFEKSLACAVSVAVFATALMTSVVSLTARAESNTRPAVQVETVTAHAGDTAVEVPVSFTNLTEVAGLQFTIEVDEALELTGFRDDNEVTFFVLYNADGFNCRIDGNSFSTVDWLNGFGRSDVDSLNLTLLVNVPNNVEEDTTYDIAFTNLMFVDYDTQAIIDTDITDGGVTVEHQHDFTGAWQSDDENHWKACPYDNATANLGPHTYGAAVVVPPTADTDGSSTLTCTVCGHQNITVLPATGPVEPTVDSAIVFASKSIGLASSSVQFSFRLRQNLLAGYADFDMILVPGKYNTSTFNEVENPDEVVINKADFDKPNATFYSYSYTDIQLYELGLDIQYYIKCYDAEGNYVARSEYFSTSPVETLKTTLNNAGTKATLKTAITDLLVVCDEAAKLFATDGSDLANATSVLEGVDLSLATASVSEGDLVSVDAFTAYDAAFGTASSATHRFVTTVSIEKVPVLNYRIRNNGLDISKLSMVVTYTSADGSEYNKTITGDDWVLSGQYWVFALDQVGLHDCAATITATATYDGAEVFTKTYSFATHYSTRMTSGTTAAIYTALAKLGISFPAAM